jgi:glyoxalase family protein
MSHHGLHHVTAIAGAARRNFDFYTRILGLRFVKKTVNFDDPGTYHFYYGDETGRPGTILTFFPWEHVVPGRVGVGQTSETAFRVPAASLGYWTHRFVEKGVPHENLEKRFGESVLVFKDPDGLRLSLVGVAGAETEPGWSGGDIPSEHAILPGSMGGGSVHHVAFRAVDDAAQAAMARRLIENHGIRPTEQRDRNYFRSVYFREPGGVLFEIATDDPGFAVDESAANLGRDLKLPKFLESRRQQIEAVLPELA